MEECETLLAAGAEDENGRFWRRAYTCGRLLQVITKAAFRNPARLKSFILLFILAVLLLTTSAGLAQSTVTVRIMTDSPAPGDFGTSYPLGPLSNDAYVYGQSFIIEVSYDLAVLHTLSLSLSGSQPNYDLAWRVDGTTDDNPFGSLLGAEVTDLSGSASAQYYKDDGTLHSLSVIATRYKIGAKATPDASEDLSVQVTLTATIY